MGDPRHPTKVIIVVEKGCVNRIVFDKDPGNIRFFIADYDNTDYDRPDEVGEDRTGKRRAFFEETGFIDSMEARKIINKDKRGLKC